VKPQPIARACACLAIIVLGATPLLAADKTDRDKADSSSVSTATSQLLKLIDVFKKLDDAVAKKMEENERHLLALAMVRLSSGFYGLAQAKHKFVTSVEQDQPLKNSLEYSETVRNLQDSVTCFQEQFASDGPRMLVFTDIDGPKVAESLQHGLDVKVASLNQLARDLGIASQNGDLKEIIVRDARNAEEAANQLANEAVRFA
jgi:hypothetical protein